MALTCRVMNAEGGICSVTKHSRSVTALVQSAQKIGNAPAEHCRGAITCSMRLSARGARARVA
eukprot:1431252-Rhodomonas_salina.1